MGEIAVIEIKSNHPKALHVTTDVLFRYTHGCLIENTVVEMFFFLGNLGQENVFYDILEQKNAFLGYKSKKLKQKKTWHFSKGVSPWFSSRIGHFPLFVVLGNLGQKNVFYDILERKNAFLCYKNKKLEKSKKVDMFPKG